MSNLAAFGKLERTLAELDQFPRRLAIAIAPAITKEIQREFANGQDPYGTRWKKLKSGKPSKLTLSGKLRQGSKATPMTGGRAGLRILLGARYAVFHQTGTRKMPARKILPERGMPASWRMAIERESKKLLGRIR